MTPIKTHTNAQIKKSDVYILRVYSHNNEITPAFYPTRYASFLSLNDSLVDCL